MKDKTIINNKRFEGVALRIMSGFIHHFKPEEVFRVDVDNWFDHKWLNFSGKTMGALGVWRRDPAVPPFIPDRITHETHYKLANKGSEHPEYEMVKPKKRFLHVYQNSGQNHQRKIKYFTNDGAFFWTSRNAGKNNHGSLMCYLHRDEQTWAWYLGLKNFPKDGKDNWEFNKTLCITKDEVMSFYNIPIEYKFKSRLPAKT